MILTDLDITKAMEAGHIRIDGYDKTRLGPNSYDLTLGRELLVYDKNTILDARQEAPGKSIMIPDDGIVLQPGSLYLGVTNECTYSRSHVPLIEGKSSVARLGIDIHKTAGFGDIGFEGYWTLEITCTVRVKIYANMPICQVYFLMPLGVCLVPYNMRNSSKYRKQERHPVPSQMFKNQF